MPLDNFSFRKTDLANQADTGAIFAEIKPDVVVHLAAQAGVRYSIENPDAYVQSNLVGFMNVLEGCRHHGAQHLIYASSSSVYGLNKKIPFAVEDPVDHPVSLYAATKKSNELLAHSYAHLYGLPCTGLRFFTVYGPWGRPDMAYYIFTKAIMEGREISVFNNGNMMRDFTYIDDIVEAMMRLLDHVPQGKTCESGAPYVVHNIGNNRAEKLMDFIEILEKHLGKKARKKFLPMQAGDVPATYADISALEAAIGFKPATTLEEGLGQFVAWYRCYHDRMHAQ
jgi:UDP-glucuronate 4-epimerase